MNTAGQMGGAVGTAVVGYILKHLNHNWMLTFWISAIIYVIGGLCWIWIDPVTPLDADETPALAGLADES